MQAVIDTLTIGLGATLLLAVAISGVRLLSRSRSFPGLDSSSTTDLLMVLGLIFLTGGLLLLVLLGLDRPLG